jgi:DNA-binding NtrC family response regulator
MVRVLKSEGYQIRESSTGEEAIRILRETEITIVVTDKIMPDLDGLALLKHIRLNHPNIPVIIMTGYLEENMEPEPDGLLIKPFTSDEMKSLVRRLLAC